MSTAVHQLLLLKAFPYQISLQNATLKEFFHEQSCIGRGPKNKFLEASGKDATPSNYNRVKHAEI